MSSTESNSAVPRRRGGLVTVATVVALLVALAGTLLGSGVPENALAGFDASAWLWSSPKGELARVNGVTGRVDTRHRLTDGQGRTMQVAQTDRYVILRDLTTGKISVVDLASLQVAATTETSPGVGIEVALHENTAFIVDGVQGLVRQLDPATLGPIGEPLRFPPDLIGGSFDASGRLWVLVPGEGTVAAIEPAAPPPNGSGGAPGGGAGGGTGVGAGPRIARSLPVVEPDHEVSLTVLDDGVAVLDNTKQTLTVVRGGTTRVVQLRLSATGTLPARTVGDRVPVTVAADRRVHVVTGDAVAEYQVPGTGGTLSACVLWSTRFYCADEAAGVVYVLDKDGNAAAPVTLPDAGGRLELEVREERLFINAPGSSTARVVDDEHRVKIVDKYANNIAGGDPPPSPPPQPPPKPVVAAPSAPGRVVAVAGNAQARLTWTPASPNGAPILRYVVEGGGRPIEVGANQRAVDVTGLTNGTEYRFTVHAVNAKGAGPKKAANPVIPTAEVPDAPISVTAQARPDGTVSVTWPAANGQGRKVVRYEVTSVTRGASAPAGDTDGTTLIIPAGALTYGTQYAFTVVAVNERGASSVASPVSNSVSPFTKPGAPRALAARTVNRKGTVQASWQAAEDNGRPISHYLVTAGNQRHDVRGTSIDLTGFADGAAVKVSVRAVNEAGEGPAVERTATTIAPPQLKAAATASAGLTSITVAFSVDDRGSPATCTLEITGAGTASGNCTRLTVGSLSPGQTYTWRLTIGNVAGGVNPAPTGTTRTRPLSGTVICTVASYCGRGAPNGGVWVYQSPSQTSTAAGDVYSPERYEAVCQANDAGGRTINATPWGGKRSSDWVKIKFPAGEENYIPFAWFRLDEGDNIDLLKQCT